MVNKVILVGNLGRDPESHDLPSGQMVTEVTLATNRKYKDRDGNRQEDTEWHSLKIYGKQAEIAQRYLVKGKQIFVEGRIKSRKWTDNDGVEKRFTDIIVDRFQMLGGARGDDGEYNQRQREPQQREPQQRGGFDDEIPF